MLDVWLDETNPLPLAMNLVRLPVLPFRRISEVSSQEEPDLLRVESQGEPHFGPHQHLLLGKVNG